MTKINSLIQQAVLCQEQNDFVSAERLYQVILSEYPNQFEALFLLGLLKIDQGEYESAVHSFHKALNVSADNADVYNYLAVAWLGLNKYSVALECLKKSVEFKPDYSEAYYNMGIVFQKMGDIFNAELSYKRTIYFNPENAVAYHNLAILLCEQGKFKDSEINYRRAIEINNNYFLAYNNLGDLLQKSDKLSEAIDCYKKAVKLKPDYADAYYNLGIALQRLGNYSDAITSFKQAVMINPNLPEFHYHLGNALSNKGEFEESVKSYREALKFQSGNAETYLNLSVSLLKLGMADESVLNCYKAIDINSDYAEAYHNLGVAFNDMGRFNDAVDSYKHALQIKPDYREAHVNLGNSYKNMLKLDEAIKCFSLAVTDKDEYDAGRMNRALTWLLKGDFRQGWPAYEHRLLKKEYPKRKFHSPRWDGMPLNGKTILVYSEQGLGDTIQFVRFLPMLKKTGARVVFECQESLLPLLKRCDGIDDIVVLKKDIDHLIKFDVHLPLLSLPLLLGVTLDSIPASVPYIFPDCEIVSKMAGILCPDTNFKVGIVWAGNPKQSNDRNRSCRLDCFALLGNVPGVTLYSLQKGSPESQINNPPDGLSVCDLNSVMCGFSDTAAFIYNLDLVISVDTAVAHLAGAIGKPVWALVCHCPTWYFQLDRDDCAWYPTMRLFRQPKPRDWDAVLQKVAVALAGVVAETNR